MYISKRYRFVYIGIPKTASTSLHRFFEELMGPNDLDLGTHWQHRVDLPEWAKGFRVVASVREPTPRMRSLWRHSQTSGVKRQEIPRMTFYDFIVSVKRKRGLTPFYTKRQVDFLGNGDSMTLWRIGLHCEDISGNPLPRINTTISRTGYPLDTHARELKADQLAHKYASPDRTLFQKSVPPSLHGIFP